MVSKIGIVIAKFAAEGRHFLCLAAVTCFGLAEAVAHPISMSSTVADVQTNKVTVEMRVMVEDLVLYQSLTPSEGTLYSAEQLKAASGQHESLLLRDFSIRDFDGEKLEGEVADRDFSEVPDAGVPAADLMAFSVIYKLEYLFESPPEFLTLLQSFGGENSPVPSVMDLVVFQSGVWTEETVQLNAGTPHVFEFDWSQAPKPVPKSWAERKRQREARQNQMLGITSYSSVYSYIYVTDREVRHEILVPLLTLETWLPVERKDPEFLEIEEQHAAREKIAAYFVEKHPLFVDGVRVQPILDRANFYGLDIRDFAQQAEERRVGVYSARVGIILRYPCATAPNDVKLTWEEFNPSTPFLKSLVYEFRENGRQKFIVPAEPFYEWKREGTASVMRLEDVPVPAMAELVPVPVFSLFMFSLAATFIFWRTVRRSNGVLHRRMVLPIVLVTIGILCTKWQVEIRDPFFEAPEMDDEQVTAVFRPLLTNIYRAFDYNGENEVYGALAQSVDGDLLQELYLKIRESLLMQEQGGAAARVEEIALQSSQVSSQSDDDGQLVVNLEAEWTINGTVEHWGHIHRRKNGYRADFDVVATVEGWKIATMEVREGKRLGFETGLRDWK